MKIAIEVGRLHRRPSRTASGGRWARGARAARWRSSTPASSTAACGSGMTEATAEELFRQVAAFASFGFAKSHAAAFARTAYESSFLKLFYPAQFMVGLINAQPMGFYPVEVLVNDAKRHGVAVLPVDVNASLYRTTTEWVGPARRAAPRGRRASTARPDPVRSPACVDARRAARDRWAPEVTDGLRHPPRACTSSRGSARSSEALLDAELARGPVPLAGRRRRADRRCPRRSSSGSSGPGRWTRSGGRGASCSGSCARSPARHAAGTTAGPAGAGKRRGGRPADGPAAAGDRGARPAAAHRVGAARRRLRGHRRSMRDARWSSCSGRRSTGSARCPTRRSPSAGRAGPPSAASSSPASTR